jgi:hypothetical protein
LIPPPFFFPALKWPLPRVSCIRGSGGGWSTYTRDSGKRPKGVCVPAHMGGGQKIKHASTSHNIRGRVSTGALLENLVFIRKEAGPIEGVGLL